MFLITYFVSSEIYINLHLLFLLYFSRFYCLSHFCYIAYFIIQIKYCGNYRNTHFLVLIWNKANNGSEMTGPSTITFPLTRIAFGIEYYTTRRKDPRNTFCIILSSPNNEKLFNEISKILMIHYYINASRKKIRGHRWTLH